MVELAHIKEKTMAKEETNMAVITKPNEANIIKNGMLTTFAKEVKMNIPDEDYWEECKMSKNLFSSEDIKNMKNMCKGQKR